MSKFTLVQQLNKKILGRKDLLTIFIFFLVASCKLKEEKILENEAWQRKIDSTGNAMLDSIYKLESLRCDSLRKNKFLDLVDSFKKSKVLQTNMKHD